MALNKSLKKMLYILPAVLIGGTITVYAASASLRGKLTVWMWSGKKTLRCNGSDVIVIRGKTAHTQSQVIFARGRCQVKVINSELTGKTAIYAYENSRITVVNSRLTGSSHAMFLNSGARATIRGSTIKGKSAGIYVGSDSQVTITKSKISSKRHGVYVSTNSRAVITDTTIRSTDSQTIYTGRSAEVTVTGGSLEGKTAVYVGNKSKVKLSNIKIKASGSGFYVSGRAQLTADGCTVTGAKDGVSVSNHGRLVLRKTNLIVKGRPVYASNDARVEISDAKLKGGSGGVYVSNRAKVHLSRVDLRSNRDTVYVSTGGKLTFISGKLISAGQAIYASNGSTIALTRVTLVGTIYKAKGAIITRGGSVGSAEAAARRVEDLTNQLKRYKKTACWGVMTCYQKHRQFGKVDVTVQVDIDDTGQAQNPVVTLRRRAKKKVRRCLESNAKMKRIKRFTGPRGRLLCRVTGNVQDGVQRLKMQTDYKVDPADLKAAKSGDLPDAK